MRDSPVDGRHASRPSRCNHQSWRRTLCSEGPTPRFPMSLRGPSSGSPLRQSSRTLGKAFKRLYDMNLTSPYEGPCCGNATLLKKRKILRGFNGQLINLNNACLGAGLICLASSGTIACIEILRVASAQWSAMQWPLTASGSSWISSSGYAISGGRL